MKISLFSSFSIFTSHTSSTIGVFILYIYIYIYIIHCCAPCLPHHSSPISPTVATTHKSSIVVHSYQRLLTWLNIHREWRPLIHCCASLLSINPATALYKHCECLPLIYCCSGLSRLLPRLTHRRVSLSSSALPITPCQPPSPQPAQYLPRRDWLLLSRWCVTHTPCFLIHTHTSTQYHFI